MSKDERLIAEWQLSFSVPQSDDENRIHKARRRRKLESDVSKLKAGIWLTDASREDTSDSAV